MMTRRALCHYADPPARRAIADEGGVTRADLTPIFDEVGGVRLVTADEGAAVQKGGKLGKP